MIIRYDERCTYVLLFKTVVPPYCTSDLQTIAPTAILDLRQLFIFVLFLSSVRLRSFLGRALRLGPRLGGRGPRLGQARGPGAAATSPFSSCKTLCQQSRCVVQRIWRRSEVEYSGFAQIERYTIISTPIKGTVDGISSESPV